MAMMQPRLSRPIGTYVGWGVFTLFIIVVLIFNGLVAAFMPYFAARLLLVGTIPLVLLVAMMGRTDRPLGQGFMSVWLVSLVVILACWPSYMFFKFGALPSIGGRRLMTGFSFATLFFLAFNRRQLFKPLSSDSGKTLRLGLWILTLFVLWRLASSFASKYTLASMFLVFGEIFNYYALFVIGALIFRGAAIRERFVQSFMAVAILIFLYAVVEWKIGVNVLLELAPRIEGFEMFNAMLNISRVREGFFRAQGTFEHPLVLAEFTAMVACFGLATVLWKGRDTTRFIGLVTLLLAPIAGWMSGSRVTFVAMGAGLLVVGLLWLAHARKPQSTEARSIRKLSVIFLAALALVVAIPTLTLLAQGKSASESRSTQARLVMLDRGIPSIEEKPIWGTGPGFAGSVAGIIGTSGVGTLDNHLLAIAIESGVPAVLLYLAALLYPAWRAFVRLTEGGTGADAPFLAAGAGALVAFSIVRGVLAIPYNQAFAFLIAGMLLAACAAALPKGAAK